MEQKRDEANREKAAEMRRKAEDVELEAREKEARASRARADAEQAQVQAARLKQEAEQKSVDARSLREDVVRHTEKANEIDPDVRTDDDAVGGREPMARDAMSREDLTRDTVSREGMGREPMGRDAADREAYAAGRSDAYPDDRREALGVAASDARQAEPPMGDVPEAQRAEGAERLQAEDLRRRRDRTDGDTPRPGI